MNIDNARARRAAMLPPGASCETCGETDPLVLNSDVARLRCADCRACARGIAPVERHHLAGRKRGPWTLDVSPNLHRRLTARARSWADRVDAFQGPARIEAALVCGLIDVLRESAEGSAQKW